MSVCIVLVPIWVMLILCVLLSHQLVDIVCICSLLLSVLYIYTGQTQKNGAVSKVNKKSMSPLTRAQRTPSAAAIVQVLMRYQQFASHAYYGAAGPVSKIASQQEKAFCVLRFEVSRSVI